jgi:hypothetical protein
VEIRTVPRAAGDVVKSYRRKRRPGNRAMTLAESARVEAAKTLCCVACYVWAVRLGRMPVEDIAVLSAYDHKKSGNIRRGHRYGFANCDWHHQAIPGDGWNHAHMRAHFGPSLMDGSRLFHDTYGSDDDLIALQDQLLQGERAA